MLCGIPPPQPIPLTADAQQLIYGKIQTDPYKVSGVGLCAICLLLQESGHCSSNRRPALPCSAPVLASGPVHMAGMLL